MRELQAGEPWSDAVRHAAAILYEAGATAVWLFGSRAGARTVDRLSDFDLAVEGLHDRNPALARAARELRGRSDIVRMESATAGLRWGIAESRVFVPRVAYAGGGLPSRPPLPDSLAGMRTRAAAERIREISPRAVIDFGCGHGWLLAELAGDAGLQRLTGVDFDADSLTGAKKRISRALGRTHRVRTELRQGLITYRDPMFLGHDAAAALEVIEHLESPQLAAFAGVLFDFVRPARVVLTTPNAEYNVFWLTRRPNGRRHPDHRFEWSRTQFVEWTNRLATTWGYGVRIEPVGTLHSGWGSPTQLAVFDRRV